MNFKCGLNLFLLVFFLGTAPLARALDFSVLGAATVSNYIFSPPLTISNGTSFGFGATVGIDLVPTLSLETGFLFLPTAFSQVGIPTTSFTYGYLDIPLLLRFSLIQLFSINFGPYYGFATSSTGNSATNDYGLMMGVSARFPVLPLLKIRVDAMYEFGLANINSSLFNTQNSRNFIVLGGLMLDLW